MLVYQRVNDNIHSPAVFVSYLRLAIRKSEESPSNFGVKMCTQLYPTFDFFKCTTNTFDQAVIPQHSPVVHRLSGYGPSNLNELEF